MFLVRPSLKNPHAVAVLVALILVLGGTALSRIAVDLLPAFKTPAVQVVTFYPGMPADIMERDITSRLERWTGQSNGVARQESKSITGVSIVKDYFRDDINPNTAMSQVTSLAMSDLFYLPPGTIPPMVMPFDPTASMPLALLTVSSPTFDEAKLYDIAYFDLRNRLQGISGVIAPAVYGGKLRRILAYVDPLKLQARGLSPLDVITAIKKYNVMIPTGDAKLGDVDYQINVNGMVAKVDDLNDIPIKVVNGTPVFLRDVARAEDSSQIQTNIVRINGRREVYIPLYRQPGANTIQVVDGVRSAIRQILTRLPKGIQLDLVLDQSVYVREAIRSLVREGLLGALLAALMILLFLGSFRSTVIIALTIPLSILAAVAGLYFDGNSINLMTLGGLTLVIGRLVDDAIVVLENTHRHLASGKPPVQAAYDGAIEVSMPVLVATVTTIVVFAPVVFLTGIGRFLFTPLALAVAFAMIASYVLAMTLVPAAAALLFKPVSTPTVTQAGSTGVQPVYPSGTPGDRGNSLADTGANRSVGGRWQRFSARYERLLRQCLDHRALVAGACAAVFVSSFFLIPLIGRELFPASDAGQMLINVRAPSGTRIERTEDLVKQVDAAIRVDIPRADLKMLISNIGVLYDWPAAYTPNSGPMDAFLLVQLSDHRRASSQEYARRLRRDLNRRFPTAQFAFDTGGMAAAALNGGLPSPIDIQVEGNKLEVAHRIAEVIRRRLARVPGAVDVRIQQRLDYPQIGIHVDRVRAARMGLTEEGVVKNVVTALNSSVNFDPSFWIDESNGNHYFIGAQYPEKDIKDLATLQSIPIDGPGQPDPQPLGNLATFTHTTAPAEVEHLNISRVTDVYTNVDGRDVGSVAADVRRIVDGVARDPVLVPPGYFIHTRGEITSMAQSFGGLGFGLAFAAVLVYLVMVTQFRSFLDPLIIMAAVPLGLIGVLWTLYLTGTTLNVQSFMGVIFMVGIAVSNSVLLVEFANRGLAGGQSVSEAALSAGMVRLRPILMTSIAAVLGLLPMAIGFGRGSEANIPLARAVVGGLTVSTVLTLFLAPVLYALAKRPAVGPRRSSLEI